MSLKGKKIILGISGGIAAYKACELVRLIKRNEAEVKVVMTPSACHFVSPLTLSVLSDNEVSINMFPDIEPKINSSVNLNTQHIYSGLWADLIVVAPATASTIGKIASGICDNLLTATVMSSRCEVLIVPSMDEEMFVNSVTQLNIMKLKEFGYNILEPETGFLASGITGKGRLPEPEKIFSEIILLLNGLNKDFQNSNILITAGPTYEPIDKVRFVGNHSSGKMGFKLAKAAILRGANVTLISGPSNEPTPKNVLRINVQTANEMYKEVMKIKDKQDHIIMAAAVADYTPEIVSETKLKKSTEKLNISLVKTKDILMSLKEDKKNYKLTGFALETENLFEYSKEKLINKGLDLIVGNNPNTEGAGFGTDTNVAIIIDKDMKVYETGKITKFELANKILNILKKL